MMAGLEVRRNFAPLAEHLPERSARRERDLLIGYVREPCAMHVTCMSPGGWNRAALVNFHNIQPLESLKCGASS